MSFRIILTPNFQKEARKLYKKYPSLKEELSQLNLLLENNPTEGTPLGNNVYKIRISIKSKGKGKRAGGRVLTFVRVIKQTIYLFAIYSKGEKDDISDKEISALIKDL